MRDNSRIFGGFNGLPAKGLPGYNNGLPLIIIDGKKKKRDKDLIIIQPGLLQPGLSQSNPIEQAQAQPWFRRPGSFFNRPPRPSLFRPFIN